MVLINQQDAAELVTKYCQEYYNLNPVAVIEKLMEMPAQPEEYTIEMQEADIDEAMKRLRGARVEILPSVQPKHDCKTCRYNALEWYEEPCDSCTMGGENCHWKPSVQPELTTNLQPTCNKLATDCISRQAAKSAYCEHFCHLGIFCPDGFCSEVNEAFDSVPSAKPRKGKWMECDHEKWSGETFAYRCSECGGAYHLNIEKVIGIWNFCPNCGASMSEGEKND